MMLANGQILHQTSNAVPTKSQRSPAKQKHQNSDLEGNTLLALGVAVFDGGVRATCKSDAKGVWPTAAGVDEARLLFPKGIARRAQAGHGRCRHFLNAP